MTTDAQKCPILLLMSSNRQNRVLTKKFFRVQLAQKSPLPHVADVAGVAATSATPWRSWLPRPPRCGRGTATLTRRKRGKRGCHATATPLPHLDVTATRGSHAPSHARNPCLYTKKTVKALVGKNHTETHTDWFSHATGASLSTPPQPGWLLEPLVAFVTLRSECYVRIGCVGLDALRSLHTDRYVCIGCVALDALDALRSLHTDRIVCIGCVALDALRSLHTDRIGCIGCVALDALRCMRCVRYIQIATCASVALRSLFSDRFVCIGCMRCVARVNRIVWLPNAAHLRWAAATRAVCGPCMVLTARWHVSQSGNPVTCLKNRVFGQNACFPCRILKKHV